MLRPENLKPLNEQFEEYEDHRGRSLCQYDYRAADGKLFSCVKKTYEECVKAKDEWLKERCSNGKR
jgi:hypothetical protein|nr:MAG TPA: hypothetical protein [Caudoviricetes sp.]